jgi:hypothetical protein
MDNFVKYHLNILEEIEKVIKQLCHKEYIEKIEILSQSSIGQHIRHIVEFYICLFSENEYVNYDERERNLLIENSPVYALEIIDHLKSSLKEQNLEQKIIFKQIINDNEVFLTTSYARELIYLSEHTIHHFALIKIGINALCPRIALDSNFGVADSTIKYREHKMAEKCVS